MKKIALIPARVESKRFYGKLLENLSGVPVIIRTYQSALRTSLFDDVFVVTHNDQIIDLIKSINGKYLRSSSKHESGTDRIAEVAVDLKYDIILNLQGDEPFIDRFSIEECISEASRYFTLEVGDLISFGTTGKGTDKFPRGHKSLLIGEQKGVISISIEKLGQLSNPIKHQKGGA